MNKLLRAGAAPVLAAALFVSIGGSSAAFAQVAVTLPVVNRTLPAVAAALPPGIQLLPTAMTPSVQPLARGNIYTLPLRPAPIQAAPVVQLLSALVAAQDVGVALDAQGQCLATAVYFESMGESLEGQLAVAQVVINRANSGRYPTNWCAVVKQKAQFSFVRAGQFPRINATCQAWRKAQAIARIAAGKMAQVLTTDVLWYHADYVAPSWGRRLARVDKIGAHIFYRA